jgi:phage major head subunit gpT-like protein
MNPRLTWTDKFAVFRTDSPIKALIRQTEQDVELKAKAEGSEFEFDNDAWQFGIDAWRGVGYGYWQRACLVTMG